MLELRPASAEEAHRAELKRRKAERDRVYYLKNAEKIRAKVRKWRADNPERTKENDKRKWLANHKKNLERCRDRYAAHREEDMERKRLHYRANAEAERAKTRRRYKADPSPWQAGARNRKARNRSAAGSHTAREIKDLHRKQRGKCAHCRVGLGNDYHADHITPLSRGGSNWIRNIQLLCPPCNLRKRAHDPIDFARMEGRLI